MSKDERYNEILRRIAARQQAQAQAAAQSSLHAVLGGALDSLNALDLLDATLSKTLRKKGYLCWGPAAFRSADWLGTLLWCKPASYHGYRLLRVVGIWATLGEGRVQITVAGKALPYAAPFYEAEAYHKLMRKGFDTYYQDDGAPPAAGTLLHTAYDAEQRLLLREQLAAALKAWLESLSKPR